MVDNIRHHAHQDEQTCVLKVSELDIHWPKLDSPSNLAFMTWRWFEPHRVPVCRLKVFKMRSDMVIVNLILHVLSLI